MMLIKLYYNAVLKARTNCAEKGSISGKRALTTDGAKGSSVSAPETSRCFDSTHLIPTPRGSLSP